MRKRKKCNYRRNSNRATESETSEETLEEGVIVTTAGLIQGIKKDNIYTYLGVPYAEAKKRFVPAEEVAHWEGIRRADSYGECHLRGQSLG